MQLITRIVIVGMCFGGLAVGQQGATADDDANSGPSDGADAILAAMRGAHLQSTTPAVNFITGRVNLSDGTELPDRVVIERVCSGDTVNVEGYTDRKGYFNLNLGQGVKMMSDVSGGSSNALSSYSDSQSDCELRGRLAGYRSSTIRLAGHQAMDNSNVGTIVLYPAQKTEGKFFSATSALAPKDARKAFERGTSDFRKRRFEQAEKEFLKAVMLQPKYADAWLGLGKAYAALSRAAEAREALLKAAASDPNYVYPYEQLYRLALAQADWQELANTTDRVLHLDPYEFPDAYYLNGVANFELKKWDIAQKSLTKAIESDRNANPKAYYVLGLVLVGKKDLSGAAENLAVFVRIAPNDPQVPKARAILNEISKGLRPAATR